jgi:hypothetical protein
LREHLGLSRTQAKGFVARIFGLARREVDASPPQEGQTKPSNQSSHIEAFDLDAIAQALKRRIAVLLT